MKGAGLWRRAARWLRAPAAQDVGLGLVAAVAGVWAFSQVFPGVPLQAGSVTLDVSLRPALTGGVTVQAPPLGDFRANSFVGPARLVARADALDVTAVAGLVRGAPGPEVSAPDTVDLARVVGLTVLLDAVAAALTGLAFAAALRRERRRLRHVTLVAASAVIVTAFLGLVTHDPSAYAEPQRTGAWAALPGLGPDSLGGTGVPVAGALGQELAKLGQNLTGFYAGLASNARASALRGDSRVVLVVPDGLGPDERAAATAWFRPDAVVGPSAAAQLLSTEQQHGVVVLPDGQVAPLQSPDSNGNGDNRFVVLYLDPGDGHLRAVDEVTVHGGDVSLQRMVLTTGTSP